MTAVHREFIVKYKVDDADSHSVVGRCCDAPIRVGDVFQTVFRYDAAPPRSLSDEPMRRESEVSISLRVEGIHAYQACAPELGPGMTGSLVLSGTGMDRVTPGCVLGLDELAVSEAAISR